jgi:outer membrane biosynthesis protein TonB
MCKITGKINLHEQKRATVVSLNLRLAFAVAVACSDGLVLGTGDNPNIYGLEIVIIDDDIDVDDVLVEVDDYGRQLVEKVEKMLQFQQQSQQQLPEPQPPQSQQQQSQQQLPELQPPQPQQPQPPQPQPQPPQQPQPQQPQPQQPPPQQPPQQQPLPDGWESKVNQNGRQFFINHRPPDG